VKIAPALVALLIAVPAAAQDKPRDYCPARPGLGSPACTIDPGRVSVETSLADWTLDRQGADRTDTVLIGRPSASSASVRAERSTAQHAPATSRWGSRPIWPVPTAADWRSRRSRS
jgi:hypothetical protein